MRAVPGHDTRDTRFARSDIGRIHLCSLQFSLGHRPGAQGVLPYEDDATRSQRALKVAEELAIGIK